MDIEEASKGATMINPRVAIPMHLKSADPEVLNTNVESNSSTEVVILSEGDEYKME
ncbi:MAG: hypothetical protein ACE5H4_11465 [Candidatus Thorarchaeota archaeon]